MSKRFSLALPSQQQNTVVVHQGTLWIRGCMVKTWKKLPVELISDGLSVKFHKNGLLKMTYRLTATTTLTESDIRPFAFKLNNDKMELYIADESSEGKEIWKEHILDVIEQLQASQGNINADIAQAMKAVQKMNRPKLLVKIIGARNLLAKDNTGTSDPYVKVSLGSSIVRTSTIQKNLHPEWGMVFPFDWDVSMRYLYVEVWDEDFVTADDFLGCVNISILALKEGDIFRKWYPLCKRSDRSHVGGEIEIEIACIRQPDNSNHLLQLFQDIQNMPEFSLSIAACENGSGQVKVRDGPFGALLNANANASADDYNESDEQHQLSVTGFPLIFPSNEIEYLEDLSLNVSLVTMLDAEKISEAGILLLTNFRLIFISLNRIMKTDGSIERSSSADASRGAVGALSKHASILDPKSFDVTDLSIDLSLASIVKIENCSNEKSVEYGKIDVLTLHYIDQRKIQFIFKDFAHTRAKVYEIMKKDKASMFRGEFSLGSRFLELLNSPDAVSYEGPRPFKRFLRRIQQTVVNRPNQRFLSSTYLYDIVKSVKQTIESDAVPPPKSFAEYMDHKIMETSDDKEEEHTTTTSIFSKVSATVANKVGSTSSGNDQRNYEEEDDEDEAETMQSETTNSTAEDVLMDEIEGFHHHEPTTIVTQAQNYSEAQAMVLCNRIKANPDLSGTFIKLFFNLESNWHIYNPHSEFRRLGVPNNYWRVTNANSRYDVCSTYPAVLAVPATVDDNTLVGSSLFRSKNRFPTLSWLHRNGCSLSRCSQPLIGITNNRNECDEKMISEINRIHHGKITASSFTIVDARPLLNARANQAVGKGVESDKSYDNVTVLFMDIANIHAVRKAYDTIGGVTESEVFENPAWLSYLHKILSAVNKIVRLISIENNSVLVHCSDGWDRTAQLTSLSMLLLDPYYRTLDGFIVLIEKEWLSFGHKFADRLGWTRDGWKDEEKSPIFVQFLDCVHQCLTQLPTAFEFNQHLLLFIMDHLYSGWFSNFMFNCEREMKHFEPWNSSVSIWSAVLSNKYLYINKSYRREDTVLEIQCGDSLVFWSEWFLRWHDRVWHFYRHCHTDSLRIKNNPVKKAKNFFNKLFHR